MHTRMKYVYQLNCPLLSPGLIDESDRCFFFNVKGKHVKHTPIKYEGTRICPLWLLIYIIIYTYTQ